MDVKIYDKLAKKYDVATKIVSFGIEELWRWMFVREIKKNIKNGSLIDVASATGEMAKALDFDEMYLIEPSREMNEISSEKLKVESEKCIKTREDKKIILKCDNKKIVIIEDTAENFKLDKEVDLVTAFMAIRNFSDIKKGIKNLDKHLKNGGYFAIVEMIRSESFFAKIIMWYMKKVVPYIAGFLVGMKEEYKLLGESIDNLSEDDILKHFKGYKIVKKTNLIFPIATMIIMRKDG